MCPYTDNSVTPVIVAFFSPPFLINKKMKSLLVYYSATGNNKALAENLTKRLDSDVEAINAGGKLAGMSIPIAAFKSFIGIGSKIDAPKYDPGAYDLVVLASPVYAGGVPPQVRSYLKLSKGKIKHLAVASVSGGGNNPKAVKGAEDLAGKKAVAVIELKAIEDKTGKDKKMFPKLTAEYLEKQDYREKIDAFVEALKKGL
jgi:menaquinone-dependent protoporphyrinogen IX oxidase